MFCQNPCLSSSITTGSVYLYHHHEYVIDIIHSGSIDGTALIPSPDCSFVLEMITKN